MMVEYKGKGILVPLFATGSIAATIMIYGAVKRNIESLKDIEIGFKYLLAVGFLLAGAWTRYAKDTYIIKDGKKIILHEEINSFFFIKMNYWADIFFITALFLLIDQSVFG